MDRQNTRRELKKLAYYCLYAWGVPLLIALNILLFNYVKILPYSLHPFIGHFKCLLENQRLGNYGHILFREIPYVILELINLVLFFKTVRYCLRVKNEINRMNDTQTAIEKKRKALNAEKEKLFLILKLSIITGSLFIFEVLSALVDMSQYRVAREIEIVWDFVNCLQGLFIFVVFICKRRIIVAVLKRLNLWREERKISASMRTSETLVSDNSRNASKIKK